MIAADAKAQLVKDVADAMFKRRFRDRVGEVRLDHADPRTQNEYLDMARAAVNLCMDLIGGGDRLATEKPESLPACPAADWEPETSQPCFLASPYIQDDPEADKRVEELGI